MSGPFYLKNSRERKFHGNAYTNWHNICVKMKQK